MTLATLSALFLFSFVSSITSGPNNIMLFSSGVNFGMWRTWPHALGIALGFALLLAAVGFGLGVVLTTNPTLFLTIKIGGGLYMLYLAWRILNSGPVEIKDGTARPMTIFEAALFQWVNPKAWVMAMVAMSAYTGEGNYSVNVVIVVVVFCLVNLPSVSVWAGFGIVMRRFLEDPARLRIFNAVMAISLVASLWPMLVA